MTQERCQLRGTVTKETVHLCAQDVSAVYLMVILTWNEIVTVIVTILQACKKHPAVQL